MSSALITYIFNDPHIASSGDTYGFDVPASAIVDSGMTTPVGGATFPKALDLGTSISAKVNVSALQIPDTSRFHVRVVFRINAVFNGTQVLVESDRLPFGLTLIGDGVSVRLSVAVASATNGPRSTDTLGESGVTTGTWHVADLVYDIDTLAAFLDEQVYSVHGFGTENTVNLNNDPATFLLIGQGLAANTHFNGQLAAFLLEDKIPVALETLLDQSRTTPQWYITTKFDSLKPKLNMGTPKSAITFRSSINSWVQEYSIGGAIMYNSTAAGAFEIHGLIYQRYKAMPNPHLLGFLITDESPATNAVGKKSLFSAGGIYWSSSTGAFEVVGQMYLDYEGSGESLSWGFPTQAPQAIPGGSSQVMQHARWFLQTTAAKAHEVHGIILREFLATGGTQKWGFPLSDEMPVIVTKGPQAGRMVRLSEFEACSFYWSAATGAHQLGGDIRDKWRDLGGPSSALGLPTTNEMPIPGSTGTTNGFEKGVICRYGSANFIQVITPFQLYIGTINTKNSEGWLAGGNDIFFIATITQGSATILHERYPSSGSWEGHDVQQVNMTFPPVFTPDPTKPITFTIDVWDYDSGGTGDNDHLGTWVKTIDGSNAWGQLENLGILNSGSFSLINNIDVSVKILVDPATLKAEDKWWGAKNTSTDPITFNQYEEAFTDVATTTRWWNPMDDIRAIFYELCIKHIAANGNCFGMSLEAIYALKGASPFALPLSRFKDANWETIRNKINVKHEYQCGAPAIKWFVSEFLSGNTHDPVHVFNTTRHAFNRGDNPVLCLAQNSDFSGAPHVVLPIKWHTDTPTSWKIDIMDPNFPGMVRSVVIDSAGKTFSYTGKSTYSGTSSSGGRFYFFPFHILSTQPRTPAIEALELLLTGTLILFGDGATSKSVQDANGNDIYAHGQRAADLTSKGTRLNGFFTPVPTADGKLPGGFLIAKGVPPAPFTFPPIIIPPHVGLSPVDGIIRRSSDLDPNQPRALLPIFERAIQQHTAGDFVHTIHGTKAGGTLRYFTKKAFVHFEVTGSLELKEPVIISGSAVETANANYSVQVDRLKKLTMQVTHAIGASGDSVMVRLNLETTGAGKIGVAVKPALGLVDLNLTGTKLKSQALITVSAVVGGRSLTQISHLDAVRLDGGSCRLKICRSLLGTKGVTVGTLGQAGVLDSVVLKPDLELVKVPIRPILTPTIPEMGGH